MCMHVPNKTCGMTLQYANLGCLLMVGFLFVYLYFFYVSYLLLYN